MKDKKECLVLFSGGKDSFVTSCKLACEGYKVTLISFNGGSVIGEEAFKLGAERLENKYKNIKYAGVYNTASTVQRLNNNWIHMKAKDIGEKYPNITNCQMQCLHCQTAMWIASTAYCIAHGIKYIACGYKQTDEFCTGMIEYISTIKNKLKEYDIDLLIPYWSNTDDYARDVDMGKYGFTPKVYEPQCLIGKKPLNGLEKQEAEDMMQYFRDNLDEKMDYCINNLVTIFKHIKINDASMV